MKSAANGKTEASAGWYWQFNRKQGYKHDGIVRTPNSTWISSINENVDWTPSLDPCALEYRGSDGKYRSSNQFDAQNGRNLSFVFNLCGMFLNGKTNGFPVRCVNE